MKKLYFLLFFALLSTQIFAQALFSFGNNTVDKEEFLRAYNKNKSPITDKERSLKEYLDLYINFKLKVKTARDLHLDTLLQMRSDLESFKSQIEESYLNNEKALDGLVEEAFLRSQQDLHLLHFFIPLDEKMKPEDTVKAWKAMNEVAAQLKNDNNDHELAAKTLSEKYSSIKSSDLGFITVFSLPYVYENIAYGLQAGETSKPYRSSKGLHVFKLLELRKSAGRWKIAQILFALPPEAGPAGYASLKAKADSVYNLLKRGGDFATMANTYSDDKMTYMTGGEMPEFGTGRYDASFEAEVFKLKNEGEISRPFASQFGYHIIKKIKQTPTPSDKENVTYMADLKQKVSQDSRINAAKELFLNDVKKLVGFKKSTVVKDADLFRYADSVSVDPQSTVIKKYPISDKLVLTAGKNNLKGSDWLTFVRDYKNAAEANRSESNTAVFEKFINISVLAYYKKNLEEYDADFKYQMDEFRDGNILFEIMERHVWSRAANDSVGLLKYYNENKGKYLWAASANIILFNCTNKTIAEEAVASLKSGKNWKKLVEEKNNSIQADSGRYDLSQVPMDAGVKPVAGLITDPLVNIGDGSASFVIFVTLYPANLQRSFEEARGLVINDYQNIVEEQWVSTLKKKYPVKVNEAVFASLLK